MRIALLLLFAPWAPADGPKDNLPDSVRPIPPKGAEVPESFRKELTKELKELGDRIEALRKSLKPPLLDLLPDVEIYHKAVRYALEHDEIYIEGKRDDVKTCRAMLAYGNERARDLEGGRAGWTTLGGSVVRGYRSKIDGSVQPYGIVMPVNYAFNPTMAKNKRSFPCHFWWHGRNEKLTEVNFIIGRNNTNDEFPQKNAFVIYPYGRFCNANKFAGEVDTFEILEHAKKYYRIDESKLVARGFSMGGAACWQFATHHPTRWVAAAPGAGFAETPEFLNFFQNEQVKPTWYEERLWHWYNATDYAPNLFNLPTVAYSGEIDKQKQAADVMAREMKKAGLELTHVIGPGTAHKYEPEAKKVIDKFVDDAVAKGKPIVPSALKFVTHTLRYNQCAWITIDSLKKHWAPTTIEARIEDTHVRIKTQNVSAFTIKFPPENTIPYSDFFMDGIRVFPMAKTVTGGFNGSFVLKNDQEVFSIGERSPGGKRHGLQGPIDDAFLDRFIFVEPAQEPRQGVHDHVRKWADAELKRAIREWRRVFRGDAILKRDDQITDADIAESNLILWGTPHTNSVMKKVIGKLPLGWSDEKIGFGDKTYDAATHVPILIYPNPLNPKKYVVLNSGFTFREYDQLNNARQTPKLPDYAIVDVTTPPNSRTPGKIVRAGFFDEQWKIQANDGR